MSNNTILLVGCGNMGFAMLNGWTRKLKGLDAWVVSPNDTLRERAVGVGANAVATVAELPVGYVPDLIIFAVKPQIMGQILPDYRQWADGTTTFVSIAAGLTTTFFQQALSETTPIIRCMPNTPAAIGAGATVCYATPQVTQQASKVAESLLSCSGQVYHIEDEGLMDAVTAISGSGPAYVFYFIESLSQAGIQAGLPPELAAKLALQTIYGASLLAFQSDDTPSKLREQVTSPGGTTAAALNILIQDNRLVTLVEEAVDAAAKRSEELSAGQSEVP